MQPLSRATSRGLQCRLAHSGSLPVLILDATHSPSTTSWPACAALTGSMMQQPASSHSWAAALSASDCAPCQAVPHSSPTRGSFRVPPKQPPASLPTPSVHSCQGGRQPGWPHLRCLALPHSSSQAPAAAAAPGRPPPRRCAAGACSPAGGAVRPPSPHSAAQSAARAGSRLWARSR